MISILFSVLFGLLAYFFNRGIRKNFNLILTLAIILSAVSFFIDIELTTQGFLGLGFFVVVMYAGAVRKGSKLNKRLKSVRKEYSILGFIVLLPHVIKYILEFLDGSYPVEWFGIIAYAVMIPLFVISITYFKKKMDIKKWYGIQRWAYLAYLTIFIHLIIIGQSDHLVAYIVLFALYTFLKLNNYVFRNTTTTSRVLRAGGITALGVFVSLVSTGTLDASSITSTHGTTTVDVTAIEDGTYLGEASGFKNFPIEMEVIVENGEIIEIKVYEYGATSPHGGVNFVEAAVEMVDNIISTQNTGIDSISGATKTTEGIQEAVIDALS